MEKTKTAAGSTPPGRAYDPVLGSFVAVLLISNVASTKVLLPTCLIVKRLKAGERA